MVTRSRMKRSGSGAKKRNRLDRVKGNYKTRFNNMEITSGKYHSWEIENGKNKLSLGNLRDAGWYWKGGEGDLTGFLVRINNSKIKDSFLNSVKGKIPFSEVKNELKKETSKGEGLYEISGDNNIWRMGNFGEVDEPLYIEKLMEEHGLSVEEAEEIIQDAYSEMDSVKFEDFEKQYKKTYAVEMKDIIDKSDSFEEFFENINSEGFKIEWIIRVEDFYRERYDEGIERALKRR